MTDTELNILELIERSEYKGLLSSEFWVENFKLAECYSGFVSVKQYSETNKISPQAIYKHRELFNFFGYKLLFDIG